MKWAGAFILLNTVGMGLLTLPSVHADDDGIPNVLPWPAEMMRGLSNIVDRTGLALTNVLFSALNGTDLYGIGMGGPRDDQFKAGVRIDREVYDNLDLMGTWTVIDKTRIQLASAPFPGLTTAAEGVATAASGTPFASIIFNIDSGIEFSHVRQVSSLKYKELPTLQTLRDAYRSFFFRETPPAEPDPDITELNPYAPWYFFDPSIPARLKRIYNPITFPFGLPLSIASFRRMPVGEVKSYGIDGSVEMGLGIGWKIIPENLMTRTGLDLRSTITFFGQYQISIYKESDSVANIKMTRIRGRGRHSGITFGHQTQDTLKGFLKIPVIDSVDIDIVPFEWSGQRSISKQFDIGYRYNLNDPLAQDAYHRAVMGSFVESQKLVSSGEGAVEPLFERNGLTRERSHNFTAKIPLVIGVVKDRSTKTMSATLQLPDGTHEVSRSVSERSKLIKKWAGTASEKTSRKFTVLYDETLFAKNDPDSVFVVSEIFWEDLYTKHPEIVAITSEIESFIGRTDLFPDFPDYVPHPRHPGKMKKALYGRSSFYYGFHLNLTVLEKFFNLTHSQREEIISRYFGPRKTKLGLQAWSNAERAYRNHEGKKLFNALKILFHEKTDAAKMSLVVRDALANEPLDYFLSAQNISFGRIQESGKLRPRLNQLIARTEPNLGFDGYSRRAQTDGTATVAELSIERNSDGKYELVFTLDEEPKVLFFKLVRTTLLRRFVSLADLLVQNTKGRFHAGVNRILLDKNSLDELTYRLSKPLNTNDRYTIYLSYSRDGKKFGDNESLRFRLED
jgi:hypothetical protein